MSEKPQRPDRAPRTSGGPERTCVGCSKADDAAGLVRVVLGPALAPGAPSPVAVDFAGGSRGGHGRGGRGAWVHARKECLVKAAKGGLARSFKAKVAATADELASQIQEGSDRRIAGLLGGAYRARLVAAGADAANAALDGGAPLAVVATDAGGIVERGAVARAIAEGRAIAWKDKQALGALFGGREEVAVCAILNDAVAAQVAGARRVADAVSGNPVTTGPARGDACSRSREVR